MPEHKDSTKKNPPTKVNKWLVADKLRKFANELKRKKQPPRLY